jgi:hypothetical protein
VARVGTYYFWHALARIFFGTRWHVILARVGTSLFGTKNWCHLTTHRVYSSLIRCFLEVRPDQELTPPISAKLHMGPKSFGTNWHKLFWHALAPLWHHLAQRIYLCREPSRGVAKTSFDHRIQGPRSIKGLSAGGRFMLIQLIHLL